MFALELHGSLAAAGLACGPSLAVLDGIFGEIFYFIKDSGPVVKVVILLLASPLWLPIAKAVLAEIQEVLAPEGGIFARNRPRPMHPRPRGEDPFLNVPLASHRVRRGARGEARPSATVRRPSF